jgi:hypothetical protein
MTKGNENIRNYQKVSDRFALWADEKKAAELSGVTISRFRQRVKEWEENGFPRIHPETGKRLIPAILRFWDPSSDRPTRHRSSKATRYPIWTWDLLARYQKSPLVEVYLGRYKVYWRPKGSGEDGEVVTDPHIVDDYCAKQSGS